jgi:ERF superfamily protein
MALIEKLFEIQGLDLSLVKDAENPHFKSGYATLGAVLDLIRPALDERGILLIQAVDGTQLRTKLVEVESGDELETAMDIVLDKQTSQGLGSGITYARRYSLTTLFNLDAEDDDGNAASGPAVKKKVVASDKADAPRKF